MGLVLQRSTTNSRAKHFDPPNMYGYQSRIKGIAYCCLQWGMKVRHYVCHASVLLSTVDAA